MNKTAYDAGVDAALADYGLEPTTKEANLRRTLMGLTAAGGLAAGLHAGIPAADRALTRNAGAITERYMAQHGADAASEFARGAERSKLLDKFNSRTRLFTGLSPDELKRVDQLNAGVMNTNTRRWLNNSGIEGGGMRAPSYGPDEGYTVFNKATGKLEMGKTPAYFGVAEDVRHQDTLNYLRQENTAAEATRAIAESIAKSQGALR